MFSYNIILQREHRHPITIVSESKRNYTVPLNNMQCSAYINAFASNVLKLVTQGQSNSPESYQCAQRDLTQSSYIHMRGGDGSTPPPTLGAAPNL